MTAPVRILGFDTSGPYCGVALIEDGHVVAATHELMAKGQAEHLMPALRGVLTEAGLEWQDLTALGVGIGPGNFTGIRLSVSAARGLALSLDIPAVGVSLLEAVALDTPGPVLACLAGPRASVYVQSHGMRTEIAPQHMPQSEVPLSWAEPGLVCLGSAADALSVTLNAKTAPACYAPASAVARIAALRWQDTPARPAPQYLRAADAAPGRDSAPTILPDVAPS